VSLDLARDLLHAVDTVAFAKDRLNLDLDPLQAQFARSTSRYVILNCCRQWGKSTTTAMVALHQAKFTPGSLVLLISPSWRQSRELFAKVMGFLKTLETVEMLVEDNKSSAKLVNGSRIVSLPSDPDTIRGFSAPSLIVEDEAAFVDDAVNAALLPMLAVSGGRMLLLSTPRGRRGHFFDAWTKGGARWERFTATATECPRYSPDFLDGVKSVTPDWIFRQEYLCEFTDSNTTLFSSDLIERAISDKVKPLFSVEELAAMGLVA
jgi:phage FluMu gp28-like protein